MIIAGVGLLAGAGMIVLNKPAKLPPEELAPAAVAQRIKKYDASMKGKDYKAAAEVLLPLARSGNAEAQFRLGIVYREDAAATLLNNGVGQLGTAQEDHEEGGKWLLKAAQQGHLDAQANLGNHYCWGVAGSGMRQGHVPEAIEWLLKASKAGHKGAQTSLATTYEQGICTRQNWTEAAKWFLKAAEQGDEWSLMSLSRMSRDGNGMPKDKIQSDVWFVLAGRDKDMKRRKDLPPHIRAEVDRRVMEWLEKHPRRAQ